MSKSLGSSRLNKRNIGVNHDNELEEPIMKYRFHDKPQDLPENLEYKLEIVWINVVKITVLHSLGLFGFIYYLQYGMYATFFFGYFWATLGGIGITAGAHRLWAHRTYKAKVPLRTLLMLMQSIAIQNSIYIWVRDHRAHHKFTDTDADPHNSRRGFFFCHVGWLMAKKHPEVTRRGKEMDMSDVFQDPVVAFQTKHYWILALVLGLVIPTLIPVYFWGETYTVSFLLTTFRYIAALNFTWLVNSAAHMWGYKSYDKRISPTENSIVSMLAYGEGWHNYHHVYPWDYKAAELGNYRMNITTAFIDFFAWLGLAYDLKSATTDMVKRQAENHGDGNWEQNDSSNKTIILADLLENIHDL